RKKLKKKKAIKSNFKRVIDFKPSRSAAFCKSELGEVSGVFINDEKRFNGPIAFEDIDSKVIEICNSINGSEEAKKYSLTAFPSKEHFQNETYQNLVPDILISKPLNIKSLSTTSQLFVENTWFSRPIKLKDVKHDNWTGGKKSDALFYYSPELAEFIKKEDIRDLTLTYKIADRFFK